MEALVPKELHGERLDRALAALSLCASRREARTVLQRGAVFVGKSRVRVASRIVCAGDLLRVESGAPSPPAVPVEILWEMEALVALNKPGGVPCTPTRSAVEGSLLHAFARSRKLPMRSVHPLHRLDTPTSGVVLVSLDSATAGSFGTAFQERAIRKSYLAWVHGAPAEETGAWDAPLSEPRGGVVRVETEGLSARTRFQTLWTGGGKSLLALNPETGRTHQLRVHCAQAGCPIVGDRKYGRGADGVGRALLHAWRLAFGWEGQSVEVVAPPPPEMEHSLTGAAWSRALEGAPHSGSNGV